MTFVSVENNLPNLQKWSNLVSSEKSKDVKDSSDLTDCPARHLRVR